MCATSCSSDDEPDKPVNEISLNLMVEDRNTTIGTTDVYVTSSYNFTTSKCRIAELGKNGGFSKNPVLTQTAQEVAVTPGCFYQIMPADFIETIAGAPAYPNNCKYYNLYADSWIYDKEHNITGVKVSYTYCGPDSSQLPEWDSVTTVKLRPKKDDPNIEVAEFSFPKGCRIDEYVETFENGDSDMMKNLDILINGNTISFSNSSWSPEGKVKVKLLVRYESVYTSVALNVLSSM